MTCPPHMLRLEAAADGFWLVCINCHHRRRDGSESIPRPTLTVTSAFLPAPETTKEGE